MTQRIAVLPNTSRHPADKSGRQFTPQQREPERLRYVEGPVQLINSTNFNRGIGKNYDGYRVVYTEERGFKVSKFGDVEVQGAIADFYIREFKRDVLEAARSDTQIAAFVNAHNAGFAIKAFTPKTRANPTDEALGPQP